MERSADKERARWRAAGQGGRITWAQLRGCGLSEEQIRSWIRRGELTRTQPRVYAVGYARLDVIARTWEAVLYAGPGGCLTAGSGAYESGLISRRPPDGVSVATPFKRSSLPGIRVLPRRRDSRVILPSGLPVAPVPDLLLDLAANSGDTIVRHALGQLDYRDQLDVAGLLSTCGSGRRGSRRLRRTLEQHLPQLARCKSPLEVAFLLLLEAHHLALPLVNEYVNGICVDMYWPQLGLIVELDGRANHHSAAQERRDRSRDDTLAAGGALTVLRFNWDDVHERRSQTLRVLADRGVRRVA